MSWDDTPLKTDAKPLQTRKVTSRLGAQSSDRWTMADMRPRRSSHKAEDLEAEDEALRQLEELPEP